MDIDDKAKLASRRLGDAITSAAQQDDAVREALRELRDLGYEAKLSYHVDLLPLEPAVPEDEPIVEDFSEEDRRALRRMLIRVR